MHLDPCFLYQSGMTSTKTGKWSSFHVSPHLIPSFYVLKYIKRLPWWLSGKESACQFRRHGFSPWIGKIPWSRKWQSALVFFREKLHRGAWRATVHGSQKSEIWLSYWAHNCLTASCWFLLHNKVNQLYVYIDTLPLEFHPHATPCILFWREKYLQK